MNKPTIMKNLLFTILLLVSFSSFGQSVFSKNFSEYFDATDYYNQAATKMRAGSHSEAIILYTKAIELNPDYEDAYYMRGREKVNLGDHYGAISDFTNTLRINPKDHWAYLYRGKSKSQINDHYGAVCDYNKTIEFDQPGPASRIGEAYMLMGIAKKSIGDLNGACDDLNKASNLGDTTANELMKEYCKDIVELFNQFNENGEKIGLWKTYFDSGELETEAYWVDGKENGTFKTYYKNGNLKNVTNANNGMMDGAMKAYFENGTLRATGAFKENKRVGMWIEYNQNAEIIQEKVFSSDKEW